MKPKTTAFLFPGQGSQSVGMGQALAQQYPIARETFQQADEILGIPLTQLAWEGPEEKLNDTINTQPALMVHSIAALRVLEQQFPEFTPAFVAGHSMGELSALVAAKILPFEAALKLARRRGELMKQAGEISPGGMAAILGLDIPTLDEICAQASDENEIVQVANDNCPGQVVISGAKPALERAMSLASEAGAKRVVPLAISIAAHSPLMTHAQEGFNQAVEAAPIQTATIPLIGNVTAKPLRGEAEIRADLQAQLRSRVRWTETIQFLQAQGIDTFVEIGNGEVLCGLVKRIDRQTQRFTLGSPEDFESFNPVS
ncbi:MAG: ACP S-malonyltransferase [Anaerolineales bacterium]